MIPTRLTGRLLPSTFSSGPRSPPRQEVSTHAANPRVDPEFPHHLGSYRIATAPEPNSCRLMSVRRTRFDSPANSVGP